MADPIYDARLDALKRNQTALDEGPTYRDEGEEKSDLKRALMGLYPLLLAQGMDLLSTENFLSLPPQQMGNGMVVPVEEKNPLPGARGGGIGGAAARAGWGALEAALIGMLLHKSPKVGKIARDSQTAQHTRLALHNSRFRDALNSVDAGRQVESGDMDPKLASFIFTR